MKKEPQDVDDYIASAPEWARDTLRELRRVIKTAAPQAKESISYRMPYYSQNGRLAYFAAHKNHCSFYWIRAEDKKIFAKELAAQKVVGSTLQIPRGAKVPAALIRKIIKLRIKSNESRRKK
ncbi:MAG TPA: DUF1801 domain-containing protein [Terriglobia bacterium]|jgi:uncharacterized protein YdhG (YjbR/CyaY superfamily)|nr:DUF1801 domain-containing protein [Terriglobia bacterium]